MSFVYTNNIPFGPNVPAIDQPNMQINNNSIPSLVSVDHVGFNASASDGGSHLQVQLKNVPGANPPVTAGYTSYGNGYETVYAQAKAGNGELFFVRGAGLTGIQLTGPGTPTALTNNYSPASGGGPVGVNFSAGSTFMVGGVIYQYGSFNQGAGGINPSTGTIKFPINFTDASKIIITISLICASGGTSNEKTTVSIQDGSVTISQFLWNIPSHTSAYVGFNWVAIGI